MSVKYAILGLLLQRESYPYELSLHFRERIGHAWQLNRGQVYQSVYRLEKDGLVERIKSKPNNHGVKWIYRATERGRQEYERWRKRSTDRVRPLRDNLLLQIALASPEDVEHLLVMIDRRERLCAERLQEYTEFQARVVPLDQARNWHQVGPALSASAALSQLNAEMAWLAEARTALIRLKDVAKEANEAGEAKTSPVPAESFAIAR